MRRVLALLTLIAGVASAADNLTGTWEGSYGCKAVVDGVSTKFGEKHAMATVSQAGAFGQLHLVAPGAGAGPFLYQITVRESGPGTNTGGAFLNACDGSVVPAPYSELASLQWSIKPTNAAPGKAKLAGSSIFASARAGHGSCKWTFTRTSLSENDPALTGCTAKCAAL